MIFIEFDLPVRQNLLIQCHLSIYEFELMILIFIEFIQFTNMTSNFFHFNGVNFYLCSILLLICFVFLL